MQWRLPEQDPIDQPASSTRGEIQVQQAVVQSHRPNTRRAGGTGPTHEVNKGRTDYSHKMMERLLAPAIREA
jgi:hypothetical protein